MHPTVQSTLTLLESEFSTLQASATGGLEFVAAQLEKAEGADEEHWRELFPDALEVIATDSPKSETEFLKIFLLPGQPPAVLFFSGEHAAASARLLARFRKLMGGRIQVLARGTPITPSRHHRSRAAP